MGAAVVEEFGEIGESFAAGAAVEGVGAVGSAVGQEQSFGVQGLAAIQAEEFGFPAVAPPQMLLQGGGRGQDLAAEGAGESPQAVGAEVELEAAGRGEEAQALPALKSLRLGGARNSGRGLRRRRGGAPRCFLPSFFLLFLARFQLGQDDVAGLVLDEIFWGLEELQALPALIKEELHRVAPPQNSPPRLQSHPPQPRNLLGFWVGMLQIHQSLARGGGGGGSARWFWRWASQISWLANKAPHSGHS